MSFQHAAVHPLDNPAWHSLLGAHARFGVVLREAARYHPDVAPFAALADDPSPACWDDIAALYEPGAQLVLVDPPPGVPASWTPTGQTYGVQLTGEGIDVGDEPGAIDLGPDDVAEMLDLVERTKPGPFRPRKIGRASCRERV